MKKVVLVGMISDKNIGDVIIFDNTQYLVKNILNELNVKNYIIEKLDIQGLDNTNCIEAKNKKIKNFINGIMPSKLKSIIRYLKNMFKISIKDKKIISYYEKSIKDADILIFCGGGIIKYLYQDFYKYINLIVKLCEKHKVDVIFNAVGVEGYNKFDRRCLALKKALNKSCVKMITTRDDIKLLKNKYITNMDICLKKAFDPAVWSNETYGFNQKKSHTNIIGLGIIRSGLFKDNLINFSEKKQIRLWMDIINLLEKKGYKWQMFTTGVVNDYEFAKKILNQLNLKERNHLIKIPKSGKELLEIISNYKGIIAGRMHANVIAYTLDVPSIGLVWNNKLKMFGESIQKKERFIDYKNFNADNIVKKLETSMTEKNDINKEEYKLTVYKYLKKGINEVINRKRNIIIFDTSVGSLNKGDEIIFRSLKNAFDSYLVESNLLSFPTHTPFINFYQLNKSFRAKIIKESDYNFVFGSTVLVKNLLSRFPLWNINIFNYKAFKNIILVGVGNLRNAKKLNWYTKYIYKKILSKEFVHSVRDEETKDMLESLGFKAINTGCPTLWGLDKEHCSKIPKSKAENVVFALRSQSKHYEYDKNFIMMLKRNYKKLYYWPQTYTDIEYLKEFEDIDDIQIIPQNIEAYTEILSKNDIDYVGLRLHGGIYAMQQKKRAIILNADYRVENIYKINQINVVERSDIQEIEEKINSEFETNIFIDYDKINEWMSQFDGLELFKKR